MDTKTIPTPSDVAEMVAKVNADKAIGLTVREVADADADADAYPTEKELYWARRKRLESYWWSDGCALIFDTIVASLWRKIHANYWELVIADRNRRKNG